MEDFLRREERPATLVGQLRSFLRVPDNVLAIAQNRDLLHRLDAAFFRVGEARGGILVKFHGGEPDTSAEGTRAFLERDGLEAGRLEEEGRLRFNEEIGPTNDRRDVLKELLDGGADEGSEGRTFWVSFNWAQQVDLEAALEQQAALSELVETRRLVIKTAVMEEVAGEWSSTERRRAREFHSGTVRLSKMGLDVSRVTPLPEL